MRVDDFDFELPEDRIALRPATPRESARLLEVTPTAGGAAFTDRVVGQLPGLLRPGDVLVFNDTRVIRAALKARRTRGKAVATIALNLLKRVDQTSWRAFARPAKKLESGDMLQFVAGSGAGDGASERLADLSAVVSAKLDAGEVELRFDRSGPDLDAAIASIGAMPLPPYIALKRPPDDADDTDYQTIFAARDGAVAAPTAALHVTPAMIDALTERGISHCFVTLHVGAGTFLPVKADDTDQHVMHTEWGEVSPETVATLRRAREHGGRVIAVGTTALRILESASQGDAGLAAFSGETSIFITPGYRFRAVDGLVTNFHLPRSTLFMLVAAFSGLDTMRRAYAHAIASGYRFYSYGDASLLWPKIGEATNFTRAALPQVARKSP